MSLSMGIDPPVFQKFSSKDGKRLESLPTHVSDADGVRYVLWSDIQLAFKGIDSLNQYITGTRLLFMADSDSVRLPLCIEYRFGAYYVVLNHEQGDQVKAPHHVQLTRQTPDISTEQDSISCQECIQDPTKNESVVRLDHLPRFFKALNGDLLIYENEFRPYDFRQLRANAGYYYLRVLEELERFEGLRIKVHVDGMTKEQLRAYLHESRQETLLAEYRYICRTLLGIGETFLHYPAPRLFLVLPANLGSWDGSDLTTHSFRLYFMCDNRKEDNDPEGMSQHVHLSNHAGYNIKQPREFFEAYGDYVLRILLMIWGGYLDRYYNVPALDTFEILSGCDTAGMGGRLFKDTITSLVAKSITYLMDLSLPKWIEEPALQRNQSAMIKTYLDIPDGIAAEGNLQKYVGFRQYVYWTCQEHAHQRLDRGTMSLLNEFVQCRGGVVDIQQSALQVELLSSTHADQFGALLKGTNHTFEELSIKLSWAATRTSLKRLCQAIADTNTMVLKLDGVTLDTHPQGHVHYIHNVFHDIFRSPSSLRFLALLNYPRPEDVCYYCHNLWILSPSSQENPKFHWLKLVQETIGFWTSVGGQDVSDYSRAASKLQSLLEQNGLSEVTVTGKSRVDLLDQVIGVDIFDLKELAFVEVYSSDISRHTPVRLSGSLKRLTVHLNDLQQGKELSHVVEANAMLQELNISYYGHDVIFYLEHIVKIWLDSSTSSCLTLIDRMADTQGRIVAQLAHRRECLFVESSATLDSNTNPSSCSQQQTNGHPGIEFLQWNCDHICSRLSDYSTSILDMAADQYPSVLAFYNLDISRLSCHGLASVEKILYRSSLENLEVVCCPVDLSISDSVARVLGSVQWPTLKSLRLSGDDIDAWIRLWMSPCSNPFTWNPTVDGPRLLRLHLRGNGSAPQTLSHVSALFVHGLIYLSPEVEVHLTNVILQEDFC